MSQLIQAKARSTQVQTPVSLFDEQPPARTRMRTPVEPGLPTSPAAQPESDAPAPSGSTAAELLRRRRKPREENEDENPQGSEPAQGSP
jgi:hypothetical protein